MIVQYLNVVVTLDELLLMVSEDLGLALGENDTYIDTDASSFEGDSISIALAVTHS